VSTAQRERQRKERSISSPDFLKTSEGKCRFQSLEGEGGSSGGCARSESKKRVLLDQMFRQNKQCISSSGEGCEGGGVLI